MNKLINQRLGKTKHDPKKLFMWYHMVPGTRVVWYEKHCSVWLEKGGAVHTKNITLSA